VVVACAPEEREGPKNGGERKEEKFGVGKKAGTKERKTIWGTGQHQAEGRPIVTCPWAKKLSPAQPFDEKTNPGAKKEKGLK